MTDPSAPVVDFVCHHYPDEILEPSRKRGDFFSHLGPIPYDPGALLDRMAAAGVDRAVLSTPGYMGSDDAEETARANDALLDVVDAHGAFYGLAALPTGAGGPAAAAELERSLERGFNGAALETRPDGRALTDPSMAPVLEVADRTGAPILVHPRLDDSVAPGALDDAHFYNAVYGREVALCVSLSNAIYGGLVDRYPDLALVFHHFGGNVASTLGRVAVHADSARWPFVDGLLAHAEFERRLGQLYVDTSGHGPNPHVHAAAVDAFSPGHVLFATDTPMETRSAADVESYAEAVEGAAPSEAAAEAMLGGNALELLANVS